MLSPLLVHLLIPRWKSTTALSAMHHLVSGMNFLNFANLLMMSPCHCHLIFLSPVHHHHHHHHHHFYYTSLHLFSTPDSKLTFSINPSHHSLGRISQTFMTISGLNCSSFFFLLFCSFHLFCLIRVIDWFYQLLNCTWNPCTFLSFPLSKKARLSHS